MSGLNRTLFSILQTITQVAVISTDEEGLINFFNKGAEEILGYKADEVLSKSVSLVLYCPASKQVLELLTEQRYSEEPISTIHTLIHKNSNHIQARLTIKAVQQANEQQAGFLLQFALETSVDQNLIGPAIPQEKVLPLENPLNASEDSFTILFQANPQPIWVYDLETLRFLAVNEAAIQHYGYSHDEFLSMSVQDILPGETVTSLSSQPENADIWKYVKKDGGIVYVGILTRIIRFEGRVAELVVSQDITKQKMTEAELIKSEARMQAIFDYSFDALFLVDTATNIVENCNRRAVELFEAESKKQLVGIQGVSLQKSVFTPEEVNYAVTQLAQTGRFERDIPYLTFTGKEFYGNLAITSIIINDKHYQLVRVTDITERICSQRKQEESEERFKQLIHGMQDALFVHQYLPDGRPGNFIEVNELASQMLGYSKEELLKMSPLTLNSLEVHAKTPLISEKRQQHKHALFESVIIAKNGKRIPVEIKTSSLEIDGIRTVLVLARDISKRKIAEAVAETNQVRFKTIFDESPIGMSIIKDAGIILETNFAFCRMLGYSKEEILKFHIADITHPEDLQTNLDAIERMLKGEINNYQFEKRYITKSKEIIWVRLTGASIKEEMAGTSYVISIIEDITERKKAEITIFENDRRLQEAETMASIGSWEFDLISQKISFSKQYFNIYEIPTEEDKAPFYSNPAHSLNYIHPGDVNLVRKTFNDSFSSYTNIDFEYRIVTHTKKVLSIGSIAKFTFDSLGKPAKVSGTIQDITERKKREEELMKAKQQAEAAALAKQQFLSTMSHELRTPMNAVIGLTYLLLQENPLPGQVENLQMLKFSSESLLAIINDILDFSKIESGRITFENVDFSPKDLVTRISQSLHFKAAEKNIKLLSKLDDQIPSLLAGDPVRLTQILNNLLSNAIKFTEAGRITVEVNLEDTMADNVYLRFSVSDTGIGIPANKIEYIFESFAQATDDITRKYGGTGLGLAITKRLLELQDSKIEVESVMGEGSRFHFRLKLNKIVSGKTLSQTPYTSVTSIDLQMVRLLLVEDNEINQMIATKFLHKWRIYPDYATNGEEAVAQVIANRYDIILMDLQMPVMNGYEATQAIRNQEDDYFKQVPIIALTADAVTDVKEKAISAGMTDFITKPFLPNELYDKILKHINSKLLTRNNAEEMIKQNSENMKHILNYNNALELAAGDTVFMEKLLYSCKEQIQQFKNDIHQVISSKNKAKFESIVHKMQPMIRLFEMNYLAKTLVETEKLLIDDKTTVEQLNHTINETTHICNHLIEKLAISSHI